MSERFLPSLNQIKAATGELPDPELWPEKEYSVPLNGGSKLYELTFKRIRFQGRGGSKGYRWIYEGKMLVRHGQ